MYLHSSAILFMSLMSCISHSSFARAELPYGHPIASSTAVLCARSGGTSGFCRLDSHGWNWLELIDSTGSIDSSDPIDSIASIDSIIKIQIYKTYKIY